VSSVHHTDLAATSPTGGPITRDGEVPVRRGKRVIVALPVLNADTKPDVIRVSVRLDYRLSGIRSPVRPLEKLKPIVANVSAFVERVGQLQPQLITFN
jgi:hypothetical protein